MVKKKQKLLEKRKLDSEKLRQYALNQLKKREREEKKIEKAEEEVKDFLEEYDSNLNELLEGKTVEVKTPWEISFLRRKLTELGYYTYSMDNPETGDRELEVATETGEKPGDIETVKVAEFRLSVDYLLDRMEELKARINSGYYGKWPSIERLEGKISEGSLVPAKDLIEALENYLYHRHNLDILERKVKDSIFWKGEDLPEEFYQRSKSEEERLEALREAGHQELAKAIEILTNLDKIIKKEIAMPELEELKERSRTDTDE